MKKYLAIFTAALMLTSAAPAPAQETQPSQDAPAQDAQPSQDSAPAQDAAPTEDDQQTGPAPQQQAAEQPGVARVSMIRGDVSSQRGDSGDWVAVSLNTPISVGDRISTGNNSRVELQLDFADVLRLGDNGTVQIANLNRSQVQVQVGQGLSTYTVLRGAEATSEIDTPNAAIHPLGEGDYRILVKSDAETQVIVRRGSADISTPQGSQRVERGQIITIQGTDNPQYRVDVAPGSDEWDSWNNDRDRTITNAESVQRTNRYYTGAQDLDSYGHWSQVPDYGNVWVPAQNSDWAPYRDGRWVWEPYYGYTWVSNEPWGWAPYHYGRWFMYDNNWAWWPGPVNASPDYNPVWSPAYVSFFGFGADLGYGIASAFGNMFGWLACGPGDWFHPWYGGWGGRFGYRNVGKDFYHNGWSPLGRDGGRRFSNFDGARTNDRIRRGLSTMRANEFGRGAVPRHQEAMSAASFRQGRSITGGVPVTPTRASLNPTGRAASRSTIRGGGTSQHFFAKSQPAKVTPFREQASRVDRAIQSSHAGAARDTQASRQMGATNQSRRAGANATTGLHNNVAPRIQGPTAATRGNGANQAQSSRATTGTNRSNPAGNSQSNARPGWRTFTPPSASTNRAGDRTPSANAGTSGGRNNSAQRTFTPPTSRPGQTSPSAGGNTQPAARDGFRPFTPPSRESQPSRSSAPAPSASRSGYSTTRGNRPALNLNQPIVRPRNNSSGGNSTSHGGSSHTNNAPRMNYGGMPPSGGSHHGGSSGGSHHGGGSAHMGGHSSHSSGSHGGGSHHSGGGHSSGHSSGHSGGHSGGGHHKH